MKILGIDYGLAKVGISLAISPLAEPLKVVRYKASEELFEELKSIIDEYQIESIVVGVSENKMEDASKEFGEKLKSEFKLKVETYDETLSSQEAQQMAIAAGVPQKKRHEMEDAYAATIMLQNYLDSK